MYSGLSFEQAPPVSAVMRFFLTVPIFGIILTLLVGLHPSEILIASHPLSLASIHVMFLGIITMAMFGALFQMQSVLGGYSIPNAAGNAFLIHLFLSIGTLSLGSAFVFVSPPLFVVAAVFLGSSILYTAKLILPLLFRVRHINNELKLKYKIDQRTSLTIKMDNVILLKNTPHVHELKTTKTLTPYRDWETDRKSTRLNSSHEIPSRMPSSA